MPLGWGCEQGVWVGPSLPVGESIDTTTPAGRLQIHVLSAVAQFERDRLRERVMAGLHRRGHKENASVGRVRRVPPDQIAAVRGLGIREAARRLGVSRSTA